MGTARAFCCRCRRNNRISCRTPEGVICTTCRKRERTTIEPGYKEKLRDADRAWCKLNPELSKARHKRYRENYPERHRSAVGSWKERNRNRVRVNAKKWHQAHPKKVRYQNDVQFRLKEILRSRVQKALKGLGKTGSAIKDLGCSIPELKAHLEAKFQPGMTWNNHGSGLGKWNVDHIRPLAAFELKDREQFLQACHYSNLQPLWWIDNMIKGDRELNLSQQVGA